MQTQEQYQVITDKVKSDRKEINHYQTLITELLNELSDKQVVISRALSLPLTLKGDSIRLCLVSELEVQVVKATEVLGWHMEVGPLWDGRVVITMTPKVSITLNEIAALGASQAALGDSKLILISPYHNNSIGKYLAGFRLIDKEAPFDTNSLQLVQNQREYVFIYEPISNEVMCEYLETLYQQLKTIKQEITR